MELTGPAEGMERSYEEIITVLEKMGISATDLAYRGSDRYMPAADSPVESEGAERIIEAALSDDERVLFVVAIGAVTNVASALLMAPEIAARMVVTWTSGYPTSTDLSNQPSLNLVQDPHASRLLYSSGVPLVYLPGFHIGAQLRFSLPEMEAWIKGRGEIGDYLFHLYTNNPIRIQRGITPFPGQSWIIWDLINVAWLIDRSWVPTRTTPTPRLDERLHWRARPDGPLMLEAVGIDRDAIYHDLIVKLDDRERILSGGGPPAPAAPEGTDGVRAAVLLPEGGLEIDERPEPSPGPDQVLVAPRMVGICGSDLHYYKDGRIGDWRILRPHVLGHEFAGVVAGVGSAVDNVEVGDRIAVEPIIPCENCDACDRGIYNVCPNIRFTGSPHTDGALQELVAVPARGAHRLPAGMPFSLGALVEPTSIAVHAVRRSGLTEGDTVMIVGAGPIGLLILAVARAHGAGAVYCTDLNQGRLDLATATGCDGCYQRGRVGPHRDP